MRVRSLLVVPALVSVVALSGSMMGCSGGGKKHHGAPIAPTAVGATAGDANITLSWADVPGAAFYVVYHAEQEGVTQQNYSTLTNGGREYNVTSPYTIDAANGSEVFFVVTAVSAEGFESVDSQEVFASPSPWNRAQLVDASGTDALSPKLVADGAGDLLVAWSSQQGGRYEIRAARHAAGSFSWDSSVAIDGNNGYSYDVSVANHADGSAIAAWRQGNGTLNDIWANQFSGSSWGTPVQLESSANSARNPSVAVSPAGGGMAVWTQSDGTADSIFENPWSGSAWGSAALVETTSTAADFAHVAVDGQSNALVVF
ncbi:MAG TPA: hypothetical protein VMV18_12515, partial [bacterium]|nr:hypothetical protein [bacterium]